MMNFSSQELGEWGESNNYFEFSQSFSASRSKVKINSVKLLADKLRRPEIAGQISRPRIVEHLKKSLAQFSATLITARAGTGKTALTAKFAEQNDCCCAWLKVETADSDWKIFSRYLLGSINQNCDENDLLKFDSGDFQISSMTESLAARFSEAAGEKPLLIVLDDLHSIFDADWFTDFLTNFILSLAPNVHLILIARTLPPLPLWRLRSKQVLNVIDEKLLAFSVEETIRLFQQNRLSPSVARAAHKRSYGRIGKLEEIIEKKTSKADGIFV